MGGTELSSAEWGEMKWRTDTAGRLEATRKCLGLKHEGDGVSTRHTRTGWRGL